MIRPVVPVRLETARPSSSGRALMLGVLVLIVLGAAGWWRWVKTHEPVAPAPAHIVAEKSFSAKIWKGFSLSIAKRLFRVLKLNPSRFSKNV